MTGSVTTGCGMSMCGTTFRYETVVVTIGGASCGRTKRSVSLWTIFRFEIVVSFGSSPPKKPIGRSP